jgi:hypothetical protein
VFGIGRRENDLIWTQLAFIAVDVEPPGAFKDEIHFVGACVRVPLLLLARLETVDVGEHPFSLEQIHLLHFLGRKPALRFYVSSFHTRSSCEDN